MNSKKLALLSAAFGGLALASSAMAEAPKTKPAATKSVEVMCYGVNDCKAHGACGGKVSGCSGKDGCQMTITCKGHNECKGKGFTKLSSKDCKEKGGKVAES